MSQATEVIAKQYGSSISNQRTWGSIIVNPKDPQYAGGAKGDWNGTTGTDDSAAIQAAFDQVNPSGGIVRFPPGKYKITNPPRIYGNNIKIEGSGIGVTVIINASTSKDAFILTDTFQKLQITICDLTIDAVTTSTGSGINLVNVNRSFIERIQIKNHFNLIKFGNACFDVYMSHFNLVNVVQNGAAILIDGGVSGGGVWITDGTIDCGYDNTIAHDGTDGIRILSSSGNYLTNIDIRNAGQDGVHINPTGGANVLYHWLNNVLGDTSKRHGIHIECGTGSLVYGIELNGCWAGTNTNHGLVIDGVGNTDGVDVVNFRSYDNGLSGIYLASGKNVNVTGGSISGNSKTTPNNVAAVVVAAGISEFGFDSVRIGPVSGRAATQSIGISIAAGASNNYKINDCDVRGNSFAGIDDNGTGTSKVIRDNLGYVSENGGSFTANGTGAVTVFNIPHGLAKAPKIYNVNAGSANANSGFFVTADATNVIVTFGTAPVAGTNNVVLLWNARM